jgi:hypothetical protein
MLILLDDRDSEVMVKSTKMKQLKEVESRYAR